MKAGSMAFNRGRLILATLLFLTSSPLVASQFIQDYVHARVASKDLYYYQPTIASPVSQVVDLGANERIILMYNCRYMTNICENARNFRTTTTYTNMHTYSGVSKDVYGFDFNTNKRASRARSRGRAVCPSNWKATNPCPATSNPGDIWRQDGQWYTTALEPNTAGLTNTIAHRRDSNGVITDYSGIRYSCDEFPPKSWVEGGNGPAGTTFASTRCAAIRCAAGNKAEQDWQGTSHKVLKNRLAKSINARSTEFTFFKSTQSVALFTFSTYNALDGSAAKVVRETSTPTGPTTKTTSSVPIAKRDDAFYDASDEETLNSTASSTDSSWPEVLDHDYILSRIKSGHATQYLIPAHNYGNQTYGEFGWGDDDDKDDEEGEDNEDHEYGETYTGGMQHHSGSEFYTKMPSFQPVLRSVHERIFTPRLKRATTKDISDAQAIVASAMEESSKLNLARLAKPLRNTYGLKPGTIVGGSVVTDVNVTTNQDVTTLLELTDKIVEAAALVAENSAASNIGNVTKRAVAATGTFWMGSIARQGKVPWGDDPAYKVFRNVIDYGAVGDGITDDTAAINAAMNNGTRCGKGCNGSTTKNAIVYFPPGTYLISTTIAMPFGTQVIGDANNRPILLAAPKFVGLGVLSTDEYSGGPDNADGSSQEYYINTANFYRQIRNVVIDITGVTASGIACLHYQVAQATSLQNVELKASAASGGIGMFTENGSGGQISDVTFTGGAFGIFGGDQQFTAQRLVFNGCTVGVQVIWDWGWVWKSITMTGVSTGFKLLANGTDAGNIGSVSVMDSSFTNVGTVVVIASPSDKVGSGSTGVILENVALSGVNAAVADSTGTVILNGASALIDQWALGPVYEGTDRTFSTGAKIGNYQRHSTLLDSKGAYFERAKPQYETLGIDQFVSIKSIGALGDGVTDDTAAFQAAIYASLGRVLFVNAGSYILTSTILIPIGAKIVGETWSQLVASGPYFSDASNPQVLLKVGNVGDVGNIEMQDLLFTTRGATAGLIMVEWNVQAATAGSAALWDCHARVGGATGTELTPAECPASTTGVDSGCSAASLMMHLTSEASGYFENMWLWGADHMLDDPDLVSATNDMVQCSIYIARGFLIESTHATWLYATASEHSVFYQYNFHAASNIFAGMLQTESPYFQPTPQPPAPFTATVGHFIGDPKYTCAAGDDFSGCDESWSIIIEGSSTIFVAGAGIYSWFSTYAQTCIDTQACQKTLMLLDSNGPNVRFQNLITIGSKYMTVMDGVGISAAENMNVDSHPFWSQVSIIDVQSNTVQFEEIIWIDPAMWSMEQPSFTCIPPCYIMLPPWTGATSTVDYPIMTVSDGTWTSTITKAPITVTEYGFDVITITANGNAKHKRAGQGFSSFLPAPAVTSSWPAISYAGPDGSYTTTSPSGSFPTALQSLSLDTADPPLGSWPKAVIVPRAGNYNSPSVGTCSYKSLICVSPWNYEDPDTSTGDDDDDYDENEEEASVTCGVASSTTTTTTAVTATSSPYQEGNPIDNKVACYGSGFKADSVDLISASDTFCNGMKNDAFKPGYQKVSNIRFPSRKMVVAMEFSIPDVVTTLGRERADASAYTWTWNFDECMRYLAVPMDACNCNGVNGKQGGVVTNNGMKWRLDPNKA